MYQRCVPSPCDRHPNWGHPDHDACGTGFVARLGGRASHEIVNIALTALERLTHRGGVDADGASLLTSLPHEFFRVRAQEQGIELPEVFGLGFAFFPASATTDAKAAVEAAADTERLRILGWRRVPTNTNSLGSKALETMPEIWQFYVAPFHASRGVSRFEWKLALLRKRAESLLPERCYLCSLSSQTVVYKACSRPGNSRNFMKISATPPSPPRSPSSTSATRPIRNPPGISRSLSVTSPTTAKSTPLSPIAAGSAQNNANSAPASLSAPGSRRSRRKSATPPALTTRSSSSSWKASARMKPCSPWFLQRLKTILFSRETFAPLLLRFRSKANPGTAPRP